MFTRSDSVRARCLSVHGGKGAERKADRRKTDGIRNAVAKNKTETAGNARYASVMYGVQSVALARDQGTVWCRPSGRLHSIQC